MGRLFSSIFSAVSIVVYTALGSGTVFLSTAFLSTAFLTTGCSSKVPFTVELESSYATLQELESRHGTIKDREVDRLLARVVSRLSGALYRSALENELHRSKVEKYADYPWQVVVLDKPEAEAYTTGAGIIFLTRGLFAQLDSEAELAAVLSHEMSHQILGHVNHAIHQHGLSVNPSFSFSQDEELSADALGLKILKVARYDLRHALSALNIAYRPNRYLVARFPEDWLLERSIRLNAQIREEHNFLPATQTSREFARIRRKLIQNS